MGTEEVVDGVTRCDDTSDAAARGGDFDDDGKSLPTTLVTLSISGLVFSRISELQARDVDAEPDLDDLETRAAGLPPSSCTTNSRSTTTSA